MTQQQDQTQEYTMWSESLMEGLFVALRKKKGDQVIVRLLRDLRSRNLSDEAILDAVSDKVGAGAMVRVRALLAGAAGRARRRPAKKNQGLLGWLRSLLGG